MIDVKFLNSVKVKQLNCHKVIRFPNVKVFTDGLNKMIILPLMNTFHENLSALTLKITQYDGDGNRLKRETKSFKDLSVRKNKYFEFPDLIKVDAMMESLDIEVMNLTYVTIEYDNGTLSTTYIKKDKPEVRKDRRFEKKAKKKPNKKKYKKYFKEIKTYSPVVDLRKRGCWASVLAGFAMVLGVAIVACIACKFRSVGSIFGFDFLTLFKGGWF